MTMTSTTAPACSLINRLVSSSILSVSPACNYNATFRRNHRVIPCGVAVKSSNSTTSVELEDVSTVSVSATLEEEEEAMAKKVGSRVKVKVPLKVYHVPRVEEVDLTGMEGVLKQYVAVWKGKRISANLPFKVEFVKEFGDRGPVKFVAHLKEDEFDFLD